MGLKAPLPPNSSWRPRFSLLGLLALITIVALAITVTLQWRELKPLRAENKRLNEERGTLVIADRSQVHAIKIPGRFAGEGRDSYRVFVPAGKRYWVFAVVNEIPKDGYPELKRFPDGTGTLGSGTDLPLFGRLDPGEHIVTIRTLRRGPERADIQLIVDHLDATANTPPKRWPSVTPDTYSVFGEGVKSVTALVNAAGKLVLLRRRVQAVAETEIYNSFATVEPDYPLDGVMAWIEPDR